MIENSTAEKTQTFENGNIIKISDNAYEMTSLAATYTQSGSSANSNFSQEAVISIKNDKTNTSTARKSYLKFDLDSVAITDIQTAFIKLYCTFLQDTIPHYISIYTCNDEWSADQIVWNNQPALGSLISSSYVNAKDKWYYFDVTDYIRECIAAGKTPSVILVDDSPYGSGVRTEFASAGDSSLKLVLADTNSDTVIAKDDFSEYGDSVLAKRNNTEAYKAYPTRSLSSISGFVPSEEAPVLNAYGSSLKNQHTATGNFYVDNIDGRWRLIDPEGYENFNLSVVSIIPGSSAAENAGRIQKYGNSLPNWAEGTSNTIKNELYFNGAGGWSDLTYLPNTSSPLNTVEIIPFLKRYMGKLGLDSSDSGNTSFSNNDTLNVFDPDFVDYCYGLAETETQAQKNNPHFIGWMSDNELPCGNDLLDRYLSLDDTDKRNIYSYVTAWEWFRQYTGNPDPQLTELTDVMRKDFIQFVYDRYFMVSSSAIKAYAPNKLYLGARHTKSGWENRGVLTAAGRYCDIITINYYGEWTPSSGMMAEWNEWAHRPFIITEWYAMAYDSGLANSSGAGFRVDTQVDRGKFYQNYALKLLQAKNCVGFQWFKYMDNDPNATGRDLSNIDGNKGIFNLQFDTYQALTEKIIPVNKNVYQLIDFFDNRQ